jgi:hypothetical protein
VLLGWYLGYPVTFARRACTDSKGEGEKYRTEEPGTRQRSQLGKAEYIERSKMKHVYEQEKERE